MRESTEMKHEVILFSAVSSFVLFSEPVSSKLSRLMPVDVEASCRHSATCAGDRSDKVEGRFLQEWRKHIKR